MPKNNQLKKSDKKFIRLEKARIRRQFLDFKKQEELISQLYDKFSQQLNLNKELSTKNDSGVKSQIPITKSPAPEGRGSPNKIGRQTNPKLKIEKNKPQNLKKKSKPKK
jgi:hypothetical protein